MGFESHSEITRIVSQVSKFYLRVIRMIGERLNVKGDVPVDTAALEGGRYSNFKPYGVGFISLGT